VVIVIIILLVIVILADILSCVREAARFRVCQAAAAVGTLLSAQHQRTTEKQLEIRVQVIWEWIGGTALTFIVVLALVLLNGFFVAAEFSIVKIRDTQLDGLVVKGNRRATIARRIVQSLDAYLSATQLGITIASLALGWVGEPLFAALLEPAMVGLGIQSSEVRHTIAFTIGFSVITFFHIILGELAPKSVAIQKPLPTVLWIARPLVWFYWLSYPFIWILNKASLRLLRVVGIEPASEGELMHSEEELKLLLTTKRPGRADSTLTRAIILNTFDLERRSVREVMRSRQEIVMLDTAASIDECRQIARRNRYSRYPLCENGNVDQTLGVVHFKDLFDPEVYVQSGADLKAVLYRLVYVPMTAKLEQVLRLFLHRKLHMAMVVDEYGATVGLVTLENVLEQVVGQIQDEFDRETPLLRPVSERAWEIDGSLPLHDFSELAGEELDINGDISTVTGWVTHRLGRFPKAGDALELTNGRLEVHSTDGFRAERLHFQRKDTSPASDG
jgi:CBS domain containing-hemolysin-like protein